MVTISTLDNGNYKIKFELEDIDRDCYCYGNLYVKLGLIDLFATYPNMADVKNIKTNDKTSEIIKDKIRDNFRLVNLQYYPKLKVKNYRKRRKELTKFENQSLGMDYLNYSPSTKDTEELEDMCIVFEVNK